MTSTIRELRYCTYCGTSFTRDEHLERHILTHTNIKPYKCHECHMGFARRDLLHRHYTVHGKDQNNQEVRPPNDGMIPKSAGRTPVACRDCARQKTKCDKKYPCGRCASRGLDCTLRPGRRVSKQLVGSRSNQQQKHKIPQPATSDRSHTEISTSKDSSRSASSASSPADVSQAQTRSDTPTSHEVHNTIKNEQTSKAEISSSFFNQSPQEYRHAVLPDLLSPIDAPNPFTNHTHLSSYDDFIPAATLNGNSDFAESPPFLMDWSQLQMTGGYGPGMMMSSDISLDMCGITAEASAHGMLSMIPEFSQSFPAVSPPLQTPQLEPPFVSDLDMNGSSGSTHSIFFPHSNPPVPSSTRHASVSDSGVADLDSVLAAQDGWNVFRCAPTLSPHNVPKTARANLERLEASLKDHEAWSSWRPTWEEGDFTDEKLIVMQLHENTRDKLLAITQTFLHKALEIHRDGSSTPDLENSLHRSSNFVLLPPARVLECFLRSYAHSFETFFPLSSGGAVDPNKLLSCYNDKASSLLVLMMIAQGAMVMPSAEARSLTAGITEACRLSLFDIIEKNVSMASDASVLRAALLFIVQAAWSGDKWQMDIAMGQRGMYLAMLRHSGMFLESASQVPTPPSQNSTSEPMWRDWIVQESQSRLIYSWLMVDQDLSFFADLSPLLNVSECGVPMPDDDRLWRCKSAHEWAEQCPQIHDISLESKTPRPLSLRDLFRQFLRDEITSQGLQLIPLQLRLLLHPLQSLVCQYCQLLSCFSCSRNSSHPVTAASARLRLEELQTLLQRWFDLAAHYLKTHPMCTTMQANLTMFHLISLNTVTNFPEIEKLARREGFDGTYQQLLCLHKRCIADVEEATFHAGQILRLIRSMPRSVRPPWWPGAVYRVALILWTDALRHNDTVGPTFNMNGVNGNISPRTPHSGTMPPPLNSLNRTHSSMSTSQIIAVDALPPDHPLITAYLSKREGTAVLTKRDGSLVAIDNAFGVLSHCVDVLDEGVPTRFSDGIRGKLERLTRG